MKSSQWKYFQEFLKKHHIRHERKIEVRRDIYSDNITIEFWIPGTSSWNAYNHVFFTARHPHQKQWFTRRHKSFSVLALNNGKKCQLRRCYLDLQIQHHLI